MSFKIAFNKAAVGERLEGLNKKAIAIVTNEALKDANYFCPQRSGELIRSSIRASDPNKGEIVWDTPYARKRYYVGIPRKTKNPNASLMWAHKGAQKNRAKYLRMIQAILDGEGSA